MADAGGPGLTGAWQEAITSAERALRGDRVTRAQVVTTVEVLCEDLQLSDRPSVGRNINYLVSLLDFLGLYDTSRVLLEHVASCFVLDPPALNMDAAVRNQLAVTFAERGHLPAAARLLTGSAKGSVWTAATLANQACVMLRRRDVERAVDAAFRARRAVVPAEGDDETEEELDVHVLATAVLAQVARLGGLHAVADELVDELEGFVRRLVRLLGGDHPKSLSALVTLAWAEFESAREAGERQRIERAGDVIALAAQRMSAILGTEHPRSLSVLQIMATVEHETAWVLGSDRRLQGANALMRATVRRADGLRRWDPWSLGLDETIEVERAAVAAIPVGHPDRAVHLTRLGNALQARFKHTGNPEALFEAIEVGRAAVAATPDDHPDHVVHLTRLGNALQAMFARTGDADALDEAIEVERAAVAAIPVGHPDRAVHLTSFSNALQARFKHTGNPEALDKAIEVGRAAVAATPDDHPYKTVFLTSFGNALQARFKHTGDADALDEAIEVERAAVAATPDDHPDHVVHLARLGNALQAMFARTGDADALDEAIEVERAAVAATPDDHPDRALFLTSFGTALLSRFARTGDAEALSEAIEVGRAAVAATPDDHPDRAARLTNLNFALQAWLARSGNLHSRWERFERTRAMQDFEDPLAVWERLARLAPPDPSHDSDADR